MSVRVDISAMLYPRECLSVAKSNLSHVCSCEILATTSDDYTVLITPFELAAQDEHKLASEFLNHLLDLSAELFLARTPER